MSNAKGRLLEFLSKEVRRPLEEEEFHWSSSYSLSKCGFTATLQFNVEGWAVGSFTGAAFGRKKRRGTGCSKAGTSSPAENESPAPTGAASDIAVAGGHHHQNLAGSGICRRLWRKRCMRWPGKVSFFRRLCVWETSRQMGQVPFALSSRSARNGETEPQRLRRLVARWCRSAVAAVHLVT